MTLYNVHVFREMRVLYKNIEAETPEQAANIAADKPTDAADLVDDQCDGENMGALVDVVGDEDYEHTRLIQWPTSNCSP